MKVAVVILNWNGKSFLEQFLPSVTGFNCDDSEVIIADNASTDDSISFLRNNYPSVRIIQLDKNYGYAKGYNKALSQVDAEYYVLLNSDVEVTENWIPPVIELMESDKKIAACQPKIKAYNNKTQFEYAGAAGGFIDKFGYIFCRGRMFNSYEEDKGQYDDVKEVFWATGACLFIRSDVYHRVGGLDEDFYAHMEEIDLCWRLKNLSYRVMYCPYSTVFHVGGGSLSALSPKKTFLNFRNNLTLLFKNHSSRYFLPKILMRMIMDGIAGLQFVFSGEAPHFFAVIKAHFSFYNSFGKTLRKRRALKKEVKKYSVSDIYNGSVVLDYFLRGKKKFTDLDQKKFKFNS